MLKIKNQRLVFQGVASLPLVILIGGLVVEIGIAGAFIAYYLSQSGYSVKLSGEAYAAAQSGIQDAVVRIARNKDFNPSPNPYTVTINSRSAQVLVDKTFDGGNKYKITSLGSAFTKRRQLEAVLYVNNLTGEIKIESLKETAI